MLLFAKEGQRGQKVRGCFLVGRGRGGTKICLFYLGRGRGGMI